MSLEIANDKKLSWNHVNKITIKITDGTFQYERDIRIDEITRIHFTTGKILEDFYSEKK